MSGLYIMCFHYIRVALYNVIALAAMNKPMISPFQLSVFHFDIKHDSSYEQTDDFSSSTLSLSCPDITVPVDWA